jgi:hypothetical protein
MTIGVRRGSCNRELLLVQLGQPSQGFRCPFCGNRQSGLVVQPAAMTGGA